MWNLKTMYERRYDLIFLQAALQAFPLLLLSSRRFAVDSAKICACRIYFPRRLAAGCFIGIYKVEHGCTINYNFLWHRPWSKLAAVTAVWRVVPPPPPPLHRDSNSNLFLYRLDHDREWTASFFPFTSSSSSSFSFYSLFLFSSPSWLEPFQNTHSEICNL